MLDINKTKKATKKSTNIVTANPLKSYYFFSLKKQISSKLNVIELL